MKSLFLILTGLYLTIHSYCQNPVRFVSTDITNFWKAYEKIKLTSDSVRQYQYLREFYISRGTPGLKSLIGVRNYTETEFVDAILKYPKFWNSLKKNTENIEKLYPEIEGDFQKLKQTYPALKPVTIYFSIGAFRSNGTVHQDRILIGSELALADHTTIIEELPDWRQPFYTTHKPREGLALLCTHEYIHTQQKEMVENLLSKCLYEGVAEFVSCKATGKSSSSPAIDFGKANLKMVVNHFVSDLFLGNDYNWLWGENRNELKVRDLGYFIGYEICERYYNMSSNKLFAIQELIELDYSNEKEVERIVNSTNLLPATLRELYDQYEGQRPTVVSMAPFSNGSNGIKPGRTKITIKFSEPLNGYNDGIDFGPLGKNYCPVIARDKTWSDDNQSWTFEADLKPSQQYQIQIPGNFRKQNGIRLKPYLIEFRTGE